MRLNLLRPASSVGIGLGAAVFVTLGAPGGARADDFQLKPGWEVAFAIDAAVGTGSLVSIAGNAVTLARGTPQKGWIVSGYTLGIINTVLCPMLAIYGTDPSPTLGLSLGKDGKVSTVLWDSPAFNAGIGSGMSVAAVNDVEYSDDALKDAVKAAKTDKAPIRLLLKEFNRYRTVSIDYHGGLRYPALERIQGKPDYLTPILTARK